GYENHRPSCHLLLTRPHAQQMTDRKHQIGTVHGVEMKVRDAAVDEVHDLFGGDGGGAQAACRGVGVEPGEAVGEPCRHAGAAALRENPHLLEVLHRQNAGHDRDRDAAGAYAIEIAKIEVVIEKELGDGAAGAGVDLGLEHIDVGLYRGTV